jgi:hypothetical protein
VPLIFKDKPVHKGVKIIRTNPNAPETVIEETVTEVRPAYPSQGKTLWSIFTRVDQIHDKKS